MKNIKIYALVVLLAIINLSVRAQDNKSIKIDQDYSNIAIYSVENNGILVLEKIKHDRKNIELKVTFLDKKLDIKWTKTLNYGDFKFDRASTSEDKKTVSVAFYTEGKKIFYSHRVMYNDKVQIISFNVEDGSYEKMESEIKDNATLKEFGSTKDLVYGIFSDKNGVKCRMYVKAYSITNKKSFTVKLGEGVKHGIDFIGSYYNDNEGSLYTMFSYSDEKNICCQIDQLSSDGKLTKVSKSSLTDEGEWPFDCVFFHNGNTINMFGFDMQSKAQDRDQVEPASAFSMLRIEENKVKAFTTTGFTEINKPMILLTKNNDIVADYFEKKSKEKKLKKGTLYQGFNAVTHQSIKSNDLYYSFFESYLPVMEVTTTKSSFANMPDRKSSQFKEVSFAHIQIACFDVDGNLKWDQNCKLNKFTRPRGSLNTIWTVDDDGTFIGLTHYGSSSVYLFKAKNGETIKEDNFYLKNCFTKDEWKDEVSANNISFSGSHYNVEVVALPLITETGNFVVCCVSRKDRKSPTYLVFKPYKF